MSSSFYTRGGDEGFTGWLGEGRIPKEDLRIEAVGTVDEASAALGFARAHAQSAESKDILLTIQRDLYGLMAELAAAPENVQRFRSIDEQRVVWLEAQVDIIAAVVKIPREFIIPGDTVQGASLDLARTVVRRAERRVASLAHRGDMTNPDILRYLNRLSSLCFVLELREHSIAQSGKGKITLAKAEEEK